MSNDIWDRYSARVAAEGLTRRERSFTREVRLLTQKMQHTLSYFPVKLDGVEQNVAVLNSDNLDEKTVYSLPGETIHCGAYMEWMDNQWLIIEKDANVELYTRVIAQQCNYLLRWLDNDHNVQEQWCIVEDGTKYLTGEFEDRDFIVARGDSRIAITIARNEKTLEFGRETRFLVDDFNGTNMLSYQLSKPLKVGHYYNDEGIYKFVLQEVASSDFDNYELGVADYYRYYPREGTTDGPLTTGTSITENGKEVWL